MAKSVYTENESNLQRGSNQENQGSIKENRETSDPGLWHRTDRTCADLEYTGI